jgi:hypothetical protein
MPAKHNPRVLSALTILVAIAMTLQGCFIVVEEEDNLTEPSSESLLSAAPRIVEDLTWWTCEYSPYEGSYYFEFQAVVDDADGWSDVSEVNIYFFASESPSVIDSFSMHYEGEGVWGGMVWEDETALYCGEATDAIIEAWDFFDSSDILSILY